jgi:superfamily I DNA and/or RNA helicase
VCGGIRVGTIDKFQGQEDEVTIISMVRSNNKMYYQEAIGFVNIPRSCVAFSREKLCDVVKKQISSAVDRYNYKKDGFFVWRDSIA